MNFEVFPIFRSILFPQLIFGMPRKIFLILATMSLAIIVSMQQYWFIFVAVSIMFLFSCFTKNDPFLFDICFDLLKLPEVAD